MNKHTTNRQHIFNRYLVLGLLFLQNIATAQTPVTLPTPYSSNAKINYVRTWDAKAPEQNPATLITRPLKDVQQTTAYFDGLGRPLQTVVKQGSLTTGNSPVDLVSPVVYDEFGREKYKYLPFSANNAGSNTSIGDGFFKINPFQQQVQFYNTQLAGQTGETNINGTGLNWAYGQTTFEASPLNRVQATFAPGNSWVGTAALSNENDRHSVKNKFYLNTTPDDVKIWTVTNMANDWGTYAVTGSYGEAQLSKSITVDEHGKQVVEFKDKQGRVILKKVQFSANSDLGAGSGHSGWLCTYYVYDNLNNLRLVIQPKGVQLLENGGWSNSALTDILDILCFRYEYDERNRMIRKKIPGKGEEWMVYDRWDRLVLTQDANLRLNHNWLYTKYDNLNRPIITGSHHDPFTLSLAGMINNVKENESWQIRYETRNNSNVGYTLTQSYPYQGDQSVYTITFYDDYAWMATSGSQISSARVTTYDNYLLPVSGAAPYADPLTQSLSVNGLVTGVFARIMETPYFINTVNIYDQKGRIIQTQSNNLSGAGTDVVTTQYSFSGQPLVVISKSAFTNHTHIVVSKFDYDDLGRLLTTKKTVSSTIHGQAVSKPEQVIASNEYDALGQLKKKTLSPTGGPGGSPLAPLTYDYNIRGWLLGTNRKYLLDQGVAGYTDSYFGFELGYDKSGTTPGSTSFAGTQYNGNIAGTVWKSKGDAVRRKYDFEYDAVNRFGKATFTQNTASSGGAWNTSEANFSVRGLDSDNNYLMKYDANGNILNMEQHGITPGNTDIVIDALRYKYKQTGNSNQLEQVWDNQNVADSKLGDFHYTGTKLSNAVDYGYDNNGNLTSDNNKSISSITYNHLNLPTVIQVTGKGSITYTYDAAGNKLSKTISETGKPAKYTYYHAGNIYENDILQFIGHEEGRFRFTPANGSIQAKFDHDYFLKDHLGNVRMVLTEEQQQDIYPAATLEGSRTAGALSMINYEKQFYTINDNYITQTTNIPGWSAGKDYENNNGNPPPNNNYPPNYTVNSTATSQYMYRLNATSNKTGLGIVLKVMSGDKIDIHGSSYYQSTQSNYNNSNSTSLILADLIGAFIGAPDKSGFGLKGITAGTMETINTGVIPATFIRGNNGEIANAPKAYINYIFFDEQFKYAGGGASRVGASGSTKRHWYEDPQLQNINVPKNGYVYIYVSNESNENVFFDNLQVFHTRGPILEETHYYPFGLTMDGISSKALKFGYSENKIKFQGQEFANKEFSDGTGLEMYEFKWRTHDPQIGRFTQVDPLSEKYVYNSTYAFSENKVISHVELEGLEATPFAQAIFETMMYWKTRGENTRKSLAEGTAAANNNYGRNLGNDANTVAENVENNRQIAAEKKQEVIGDMIDYGVASSKFFVSMYSIGAPPLALINSGLDYAEGNYIGGTLNLLGAIGGTYAGISSSLSLKVLPKGAVSLKAANNLAVNRGSNIALGVTEHLDDFAKSVNGTTWKTWGTQDFTSQFMSTISNSSNKIHFNMTGPDGNMINAWKAVSEGTRGLGASRATSWELFQLYSNPNVLQRTTFYFNGKVIPSPF